MNFDQYSDIIYTIAGNFGAAIEPATMDAWFELLKSDGVSIMQLRAAAAKLMRTKKTTYGRMPTYVEIMEAIQGQTPQIEDRALTEANKILDHLRIHGATLWPEMSDPITRQLMTTRWYYPRWAANCVESENHWWVKQFCEAYLATGAVNPELGVAQISERVRPLLEMVGGKR